MLAKCANLIYRGIDLLGSENVLISEIPFTAFDKNFVWILAQTSVVEKNFLMHFLRRLIRFELKWPNTILIPAHFLNAALTILAVESTKSEFLYFSWNNSFASVLYTVFLTKSLHNI